MSDRAKSLAARFEQHNQRLMSAAEGCTEEEWRTTADDDKRAVGTVAHHLASSYSVQCDLIEGIACGETVPAVTWDMVHEMNAEHAEEHAIPSQDETVDLLLENGRTLTRLIVGLDDEQLQQTADLPFLDEAPVTTKQFVEQAIIEHIEQHLNSMQTAAGRL